jgi:hypothetical protein
VTDPYTYAERLRVALPLEDAQWVGPTARGTGSITVGDPATGWRPTCCGSRSSPPFGFLAVAGWLAVEASRRLPAPYTAYAITGLMLPLSVPALDEPLKSLPRFMLVLFPLWIALALWARERGRVRGVLVVMGTLLAVSSALFTTWVYPP